MRYIPFIKKISILFLLSTGIFFIYSNSFNASWHFDDFPNIINNHYLHLRTLKSEDILNSLFSNPSNPYHLNTKPYRPVACISFALNWYFSHDNVFTYHIVNISIHILTAFFLYLFILNIFESPNLSGQYKGKYFIAGFTTVLWAVNPIHTQAVTYIVQRMTLLAGMFYILSLYSYIKAKNFNSLIKAWPWFIACLLFYLLAMGSKENAAILPGAVFIIEILFYRKFSDNNKKILFTSTALVTGILLILPSIFFFLNGNILSFLKGYSFRTFSLTERLLTEPRIIIFYLSQIFFPFPNRFSITHDVILSKSIFSPWTTIPAIFIILFLIIFGIYQARKNPLISFSIFFFFLNHLIESTIIPLELIFEHRNYLPSFFVFLPFALFVNKIIISDKKNITLQTMVYILIISLVMIIGYSTFLRNKIWKTNVSLWTDAMGKAPNSARPYSNIAIELAWGINSTHPSKYDMAIELLKKSLTKYQPSPQYKADIFGNMGSIYYLSKHDYDKALTYYRKALQIRPGHLKFRRYLVRTLMIQGKWKKGLQNVNILTSSINDNEDYFNLKGLIMLWTGDYNKALINFKKGLTITPNKTKLLKGAGVALDLLGDHKMSEFLLLQALKNSPQDLSTLLYLIENSIRARNNTKTKEYTGKLLNNFDMPTIKNRLIPVPEHHLNPPAAIKLVQLAIENFSLKQPGKL